MLTNHRGKPSPGWGRWREATDEGEIGEWNHFMQPSAVAAFPFEGEGVAPATDEGEIGERTI